MAPLYIPTLGHAFSSCRPTRYILKKHLESLSNLKFDGESKIFSFGHIYQFMDKCKYFDITNDNEICRSFTLTFRGRIWKWYKVLPTKSIHSWDHFMEVFMLAHQNYNYEELCLEIENISMHANESLDEFHARFMSLCFRFHLEGLPSKKYLIEYFICLVLRVCERKKSNQDKHGVLNPLVDFDSTSNFIEPTNEFETVSQLQTLGVSFTYFQNKENDFTDLNLESENIAKKYFNGCDENK
jgi:hypothetical protein